jgi:hypothetical protein
MSYWMMMLVMGLCIAALSPALGEAAIAGGYGFGWVLVRIGKASSAFLGVLWRWSLVPFFAAIPLWYLMALRGPYAPWKFINDLPSELASDGAFWVVGPVLLLGGSRLFAILLAERSKRQPAAD